MKKSLVPIILLSVVVIGGLFYLFTNSKKIPSDAPRSVSSEVKHDVTLDRNGYSPKTITIKKGEKVMWINHSGQEATVNSDPHPTHNFHRVLNLGQFPDGSSVQAVFGETGTFTYHNHFIPSQTGTVIVE